MSPPEPGPLPRRWRGPRQLEPTLIAFVTAAIAYFLPTWVTVALILGGAVIGLVVHELRIRARVRDQMMARSHEDERPDPEPVP